MAGTASILVVDDDQDFAEGLAMALEGRGYSVETTGSGLAAIELSRQKPYDFIFMDVKLPKKNGVECFLEIKRDRPRARVIMMTGYSVEQLLKQAVDNGALRVLYKPLDLHEALRIIEEHRPSSVLIVDDDPDFANSLKLALDRNGFRCHVSTNGRDACGKLEANRFDVLILDLRMPEWGGLQTCLELRKRGCNIPTIVVTAYASDEGGTITALKEMGVQEVLKKPFDPRQLIQLLETGEWESRRS